jgi:hypothetical protein
MIGDKLGFFSVSENACALLIEFLGDGGDVYYHF